MAKTDLTNQRQVFVEEYVRSGDHLEAAKKAGYKDTHTLRNQFCKLRREYADQITDELHRNFAEIALSALCMMSGLRAIPQPSELLYLNQAKIFTKRRLTRGNTLDPAPQPSV
jgi:hypothetical protein